MIVSKCHKAPLTYTDDVRCSECHQQCTEIDVAMPYGSGFLNDSLVEVPIEDLTIEQLREHAKRLRSELNTYKHKTDQEVRQQNRVLWAEIHATGGQLESICTTLAYYGLGGYNHTSKETHDRAVGREKGYISTGVRKLAQMTDAQKAEALERHKK